VLIDEQEIGSSVACSIFVFCVAADLLVASSTVLAVMDLMCFNEN
jgi:hypothetical protein